jgi:uracil-DNA glycosylase family 4
VRTVKEVKGCEGCPLRKLNPENTFVEPLIGAGLEIAIGDAPDKTAQAMGHPMVGPTLGAMFRKAGIEKDDVTLMNVLQCRPPQDVFPTDKKATYLPPSEGGLTVATCLKNHVIPMLKSRPWERVIMLGDQPTAWVAAKWASADKWRGSVLPVPAIDPDRPLGIVTLSPEQVQKQQKMFPVVVNDLRKPMSWPEEHYNLFPSVADVRAFTATEFAFDIETSYTADANGKREVYLVALSDRSGTQWWCRSLLHTCLNSLVSFTTQRR